MNETQHGHLLLADISGYTSYVASTELTHSQEILTELLECIIECFKPLLTISKIEGDAIFAHAPETKIPRGEAILELIESTYVAFRGRREAAHRRTTCTCNACRNIPNLDLKFVAHHGDYFVQNIAGTKELVGSDVNLIHRLLKNHVSESTGWRAYALFSEQSLRHLEAQPEGLFECVEGYEHLGEVRVCTMDNGKEIEIARRQAGDYVGDMALISREPRMASLIAVGDVRTLCIDHKSFEGLLRERPDVSLSVIQVLNQRLKEASLKK